MLSYSPTASLGDGVRAAIQGELRLWAAVAAMADRDPQNGPRRYFQSRCPTRRTRAYRDMLSAAWFVSHPAAGGLIEDIIDPGAYRRGVAENMDRVCGYDHYSHEYALYVRVLEEIGVA